MSTIMLNQNQLQEIKSSLEALEKQLEVEIEETKSLSQPVTLDQQSVGRVSRIDAIQQQQMHLSSLRRLEQRLSLVKAAHHRLSSEEFGDCKICEEPIPFERLKARPESAICIACAKKAE